MPTCSSLFCELCDELMCACVVIVMDGLVICPVCVMKLSEG